MPVQDLKKGKAKTHQDDMFTSLITPDAIEQINEMIFCAETFLDADKDAFLTDHVLYGEPIVPGAVMLELMAECGRALLPEQDHIIIEDFKISRKLKVKPQRRIKLHIRKTEDGFNIKICGDFVKKGRVVRKDVVYAESLYKAASVPKSIQKDTYKNDTLDSFKIHLTDIYCSDILSLGPFFQNLKQEICFSKSHFKGFIRKENAPAFLIEPALVDAGFQMGDLKNRIYNERTVLPVGIDHFCFFNPLSTPTARVYGVFKGQEGDVSLHDFIICDENDEVIMMASGVRQQFVIKIPFDLLKHLQGAHERCIQ